MTEAPLRFGRCEIDVAGCALHRDGRLVAIEPRPFDLLVQLIRQRHRVVSSQELLEKVWASRSVSTSALARAVMKLRQAVGETSAAPLIRTVPKVGYQFIAPLTGAADAPAGPSDALTFALLPFENTTGDPALDWTELGLMAMVTETLAHDRRLSLVAMPSLLGTLRVHRALVPADRAAALQRDTGAHRVVHGRLSRTAAGVRLDFRLYGDAQALTGSVVAAQPVELAPALAQALTQALFHDAPRATPAAVPFRDPMAGEAYARGLQMAAEQRWSLALNLFRMALELEPGSPAVQLELLRALAPSATDSTEIEALAAVLLAHAERDGDAVAAAQVHRAMGSHHLNRRSFAQADTRLQLALQLADGHVSFDWTAQTLLVRCAVSLHQRRFADVHTCLDRARALCEHSGNRALDLTVLNVDACLASVEGRHEHYVQLSVDGVRRARALRRHRNLCDACGNASTGLAELGRLAEAVAYAEEGFAAALALNDQSAIEDHAANACGIYRLARASPASGRLLAELERVQSPTHRQEAVWRARGHHAAASGDAHEAARCLGAAIQLLREAGFSDLEQDQLPWLIEALILADRGDEAEAEIMHAAQLAEAGNPALQAHLLLLRAVLEHRQGRPGEAVQFLEQVLATPAAPLWRAWACADAAWLLAEAGDGSAARWLERIDAPLATLPVVLAAQARVLYAAGDAVAAAATHRRCLAARATPAVDDYLARLGALYSEAAEGAPAAATSPSTAPALPRAPVLPSRL